MKQNARRQQPLTSSTDYMHLRLDYLENEDENSTDWSWKLKIDFP